MARLRQMGRWGSVKLPAEMGGDYPGARPGPVLSYQLPPEELEQLQARLANHQPGRRPVIPLRRPRKEDVQMQPMLQMKDVEAVVRTHPDWGYQQLAVHFGMTRAQLVRWAGHAGFSLRRLKRELGTGQENTGRAIAEQPGSGPAAAEGSNSVVTIPQDSGTGAEEPTLSEVYSYRLHGRVSLRQLQARLERLSHLVGPDTTVEVEITVGGQAD